MFEYEQNKYINIYSIYDIKVFLQKKIGNKIKK